VTTSETDNEWESVMVQRVLAVDNDGSGHVVTRALPWVEDAHQRATAIEEQHQVTYVLMEPLGKVRTASTPTPPSTYTFPVEAVAAGVQWESATLFPLPPSGQVAQVPFFYRLRGLETYNDAQCAVIEVEAPGNEWELTLPESGESVMVTLETRGLIYFDYVRGFMVRTEMETATQPRLGAQTVCTVTTSVQELISAS
jgi:hypothetical protein